MSTRKKYSQISSDSHEQAEQFSSDDPPQHAPATKKVQRAKRSTTFQKNYQTILSEQQSEESSGPAQYIFYKGGRVSKILAQRYRVGTKTVQRLCKFAGKSYLHTEWLTDKEAEERNIQMIKQNKRNIEAAEKALQQIHQKYGPKHFFNPLYTKVDRILTTAVLFPVMHHKKGSEMNGKWSESMMLVCSKILNFFKNHEAYGVIQKDESFMSDANQLKKQGEVQTRIEHVINRIYLDKYQNPEQYWKDVGQSIKSLNAACHQTEQERNAEIITQCIVFLYWQWFSLSKQKFLKLLPQGNVYDKIRRDLQNQSTDVNFRFSESGQKFQFEDLLKNNIFIQDNYMEKPASDRELLLLHPGRFTYAWLNAKADTDYSQMIFKHLEVADLKRLDLNVEIDSLYLIKWCDLDYDEVTWEKQSDIPCVDKIQNFKQYSKIPPKKQRQKMEQIKKMHSYILNYNIQSRKKGEQNPNQTLEKYRRRLYHLSATGRQIKQFGGQDIPVYKDYKILKQFQLEGLNWLIKSWHQRRNCILADEMGLGKTIQTIAFLNHLHVFEGVTGPFLVVAPVSTLKQWRNEIESWSDLNCVLYKGKKQVRDSIEDYQFFHKFVTNQGIFVTYNKLTRFQVLLTNYQIFVSDVEKIKQLPFQHIILDEAHRIKNSKSKIAQALKTLPCPRILLLTGTPIQNNTSEIFGLLNIIEPRRFASLQEFKQKYGHIRTAQQLSVLKETLKPYLMRRVKSDVEKSIPKLSQMIVTLDLTKTQKAYYRSILEKNKNQLISSINSVNINNISICLRQVCDHPFLLSDEVEDEITISCDSNEQKFDKFINCSSKMIFVHKFLMRCRQKQKKTLIFTQFLNMMKLLREYCIHFSIPYEMLDGSVNYQQRQTSIDRFNKTPQILVFIISTKAGGIGINLTSATNIIIYDSDWNPQNDIQAIARAHRIGQVNSVSVYRLITTQTYEDILYKSAVKKLGIGLAILDNEYFNNKNARIDPKKEKSAGEIEKLLRDGVLGFLKNEDKDTEGSNIENESIEDIIKKSSTQVDFQTKDCSFTKTKFDHSAETQQDNISLHDPKFWEVALENVQSPLQKLVKKMKDQEQCKKIFDSFEQQCRLMIEANDVVFNLVKSKVSMTHFNAQDERQLRKFLQKITYSRQFHKQYKSIANDWLQQIEKPSRRFEKLQAEVITSIVRGTLQVDANAKLTRNRNKKYNEDSAEVQEVDEVKEKTGKQKSLLKYRNNQIGSSEEYLKVGEEADNVEEQEEKPQTIQRPKKLKKQSKPKIKQKVPSQQIEPQQDVSADDASFYLENNCEFCQRKQCSKLCKGRCKRVFHKICYQKYKSRQEAIPTQIQLAQMTKSKIELMQSLAQPFECYECALGEAKCNICGSAGEVIKSYWMINGPPKRIVRISNDSSSKNQIDAICEIAKPADKQAVFECRIAGCRKAYHLKCLKQTKKELQFQIYANNQERSYPIKCPMHFCSLCKTKVSSKKSCVRCPVTYHSRCKASKSSTILQLDEQNFICNIHMTEDEQQIRKAEDIHYVALNEQDKKQAIQLKKAEKLVMKQAGSADQSTRTDRNGGIAEGKAVEKLELQGKGVDENSQKTA